MATMLRIERADQGPTPTIRLIGRIRSEHLEAVGAQLDACGRAAIDLAEVTMVDLEAVRFLSARECEGFELLNCAPFIREWIRRERERGEAYGE
jgi:hypothetical protein